MADTEQEHETDDRESRIRRRAHRLWLNAGCPTDAALDNWLEAEAQDDADAEVDTESKDSFPASDPPSQGADSVGRSARRS